MGQGYICDNGVHYVSYSCRTVWHRLMPFQTQGISIQSKTSPLARFLSPLIGATKTSSWPGSSAGWVYSLLLV